MERRFFYRDKKKMKINRWNHVVASLLFCVAGAVLAQEPARNQEAEMKAASEVARAAAKNGPADIALKDQATLKLPAGYAFVPQPQADQLLKAMGNGTDPRRIGLVFPPQGDAFVVARYFDSGYVKDEEARDWKADELLKGLKEGTEENNKERASLGMPPMEIVGWVQPPNYDAATHRLVWSIESQQQNAITDAPHGINYNTYVLGREGYLSLNLVTAADTIAQDKSIAATLLQATSFNAGKTYADFNASSDKVAEYGIAALVAGVAAKKLGFFALGAAFAAKFAKVIGLAVLGLLAAARKLMGRKPAAKMHDAHDAQEDGKA
jgi:uncharacterized membrane-anchored protein